MRYFGLNPIDRKQERGVVLFVGMFGLLLLLALGALVVDIARLERYGRSIQRAVDSASLAAALHLRGDPYAPPSDLTSGGWLDAKRAAILALRNNLIAELSDQVGAGEISLTGQTDRWEDEAAYNGNMLVIGRLAITIERGAWLYCEGASNDTDGDTSSGPYFQSLESPVGTCPDSSICGGDNYRSANSARIQVRVSGIRSFFPLAWASSTHHAALEREAVASLRPVNECPSPP